MSYDSHFLEAKERVENRLLDHLDWLDRRIEQTEIRQREEAERQAAWKNLAAKWGAS